MLATIPQGPLLSPSRGMKEDSPQAHPHPLRAVTASQQVRHLQGAVVAANHPVHTLPLRGGPTDSRRIYPPQMRTADSLYIWLTRDSTL